MITQCHRMNVLLILLITFTITAAVVNKNDTLSFVRSRYSHRWRNLITGGTVTPGSTTKNIIATTDISAPSLITLVNSVEMDKNAEHTKLTTLSDGIASVTPNMQSVVDPLIISSFYGRWLTTTEYSKQRSFTHSTDYDYYSENEIEEASNLNQ